MIRAKSDKNFKNLSNKSSQLNKLNNLKFNSTLFRYKTKNKNSFSSKYSAVQPEYFLQNYIIFNEKKSQSGSNTPRHHTKDKTKDKIQEEDKEVHKDKEAASTKSKINLNKLHIFTKLSTTIHQLYNDLFVQMKDNIDEKKAKSSQIEENVNLLSEILAKSNYEVDQTKEMTYLAETSALRLSCNLKRALLHTGKNDVEIKKVKDDNETMKNAIAILDKEKIILVNTINRMLGEIEEMEYHIKKLPKLCDMIENDNKNIKSSILIIQRKRDEAILDMRVNDTKVEWQYQQISEIVKDYQTQLYSDK